MPRIGGLVVVDTWVRLTRCEPGREVTWGAGARIGNRTGFDAWAGVLHLPTWARPPGQPGCVAWGAFPRLPYEPLRSRIAE